MKLFDVIIIGASISGASLAACLGMEAVEVALIDKDRFPRRKACGEGLSNIAIDALDRMGLKVDRAIQSGVRYFDYRFDLEGRSVPFAKAAEQSLNGVGVERLNLDTQLVDQASALPSVSPFFESTITSLSRTERGHAVHLSTGEELHSRFLVLADGAHSPGANRLGIPKIRKKPPMWGISFVMEGHYTSVPDEVVVLLKQGYEINCTPVSESRLNVTFLAARKHVKALQNESLREDLLLEACRKSGFCGKPLDEPLQVGPVASTRRPCVSGSTLLLGDAAETLDPVAGMGMTHGILMAEIAANTLTSILHRGADPETTLRDHSQKVEAISRPFRGFTRLTASLLRSPARRILLPALASTSLPGRIRTALDDSFEINSKGRSLPERFLFQVGA
jgi:2-polyprenyl-6-methoxyphenol hydroxylase-like FAD-dependent oxidoreductase